MHCGAELIHHVHPDGRAPGRENLLAAGVEYDEFVAEGMSEDAALLIAYEAGATLIVAVGTHATMVEFLDKGRRGMASTFLTRLRLGPVLVDAKGVSRLYEGRIRRRDMVFLVAFGDRRDGRDDLRVAFAPCVPRRVPLDVLRHLGPDHELVLSTSRDPSASFSVIGRWARRLLGSPCSS